VGEAQLEVACLVAAAGQRRNLGRGGLTVVGMEELEVRACAQLLERPAERALDRRVGVLDVAVEPRGDEEVQGQREEPLGNACEADGRRSARGDSLCSRPWVQSAWGTDVVRYA
jgi:hypothetical protein